MTEAIEPGDLVEVGRRLRRLLSAYDNASHALEGSLHGTAPQLEILAKQLRTSLGTTSNLVFDFLVKLEETPEFTAQRTSELQEKAT